MVVLEDDDEIGNGFQIRERPRGERTPREKRLVKLKKKRDQIRGGSWQEFRLSGLERNGTRFSWWTSGPQGGPRVLQCVPRVSLVKPRLDRQIWMWGIRQR